MKFILLLLFVFNAFAATSFRCIYNDQSKNKIKITGRIDESGGVLKIKGSYINGFDETKIINIYPYQRKNEEKFQYAKFSNKTSEDFEKKKFITPFYRISVPKELFKSKSLKKFQAYFGFYYSESPSDDILEELPPLDCRLRLI